MASLRKRRVEKHPYIERRRGVCGGRPVLKASSFASTPHDGKRGGRGAVT